MRRLFRSALLIGGAFSLMSGCGPRGEGVECGDSFCRAGTVCDPETRLCVDNLEPQIAITEPRDGATVTGTTLTVKGTITDDQNTVLGPELTLDDGTTWVPLTPAEDGSFTIELPLPEGDSAPLVVKARAKDSLQQEGTGQVKVTLDNVAPSCTLQGFEDNQVFALADGPTIELQWLVADGSGSVQTPKVQLDGKDQPLLAEPPTVTFAWTLDPADDGVAHTVVFSAADPNGNHCELSSHFTVDQVAPALTLTQPSPTQPTIVGGPDTTELVFKGTMDKDPDATKTRIFVDFGDDAGEREVTERSAPNWQLAVPLPEEDFVPHDVKVRAVDLAGNETVLQPQVTVDRVAPQLTITSPAADQKFNIADLDSSGGQVNVNWTTTDGDKDGITQSFHFDSSPWASVAGTYAMLQPPASDNGATHTFEVRALDGMGNQSIAKVNFLVDLVAPMLTSFSAANNTRMNPRELALTFNEPVTFIQTPPTTLLSPNDGTFGGFGNVYTITALKGDTIYSASLPKDTVEDDFGNRNPAATPITFATEPATPASGSSLSYTIKTGTYETWDAVSDEDGVVSVAVLTTGSPTDWGEFNPVTGIFGSFGVGPTGLGTLNEFSMSSNRQVSGLGATRYRGFTQYYRNFASAYAYYGASKSGGGAAMANSSLAAVVTVPRGIDEPQFPTISIGDINSSGSYERGSYSRPTNLPTPLAFSGGNGTDWVAFGYNGQNLAYSKHGCSTVSLGGPSCYFNSFSFSHSVFTGDIRLSGMYSGGALGLAVYDTSSFDRAVDCFHVCTGTGLCPVQPGPSTYTTVKSEGLYVAPKWTGNWVIGARKTASGIELLEYDLASTCPALMTSWTSLGTAPNTSGATITAWRPVMFAKKPGVIYQDGSTLKIWIP